MEKMIKLLSKNPLVEKIVEGNASEEVLELLFAKQLPFTEEEYLECLVFILQTDHLKSKALESLKDISENVKIRYVENYSKTITYQGRSADLLTQIDITPKMVAEQKVRESEQKYRSEKRRQYGAVLRKTWPGHPGWKFFVHTQASHHPSGVDQTPPPAGPLDPDFY